MNEKIFDTARPDPEPTAQTQKVSSTIEVNAVKKIVRENWESKLKEKGANVDVLGRHAEFMNKEFGSLGYETMCMQNVVANTKHMSKGEMLAYTRMLEALAIGYKSRFGLDFGGLLIAGATLVSRDLRSMRKNFDYFMMHMSKNSSRFERAIEKDVGEIERLNYELGRKDSGIFRFFRKRKILALKRRIRIKRDRIGKFETKRVRYVLLSDALNARVFQTPKIKQPQ